MNETQFKKWAEDLAFSDATTAKIQRIRSSPPSRNVKSGKGNVTSRVPIGDLGFVVQSESRTNEKPGLRTFYQYDAFVRKDNPDDQVIEFYDQPEKIQLKYLSKNGGKSTALHTPDFFVLRQDSAGWEEWKTDKDLEKISEDQPNRYVKDEDGIWRCPPGEEYASRLGLYYRLRVQSEIDWNVYSNLEYLHEYLAKFEIETHPEIEAHLIQIVNAKHGITVSQILLDELVTADDLYQMIARNELYIDLSQGRLADRHYAFDDVQVFVSEAQAEAFRNLQTHHNSTIDVNTIQLHPGASLVWDGEIWILLNEGELTTTLQYDKTKNLVNIDNSDFRQFLREKSIVGLSESDVLSDHAEVAEIRAKATVFGFRATRTDSWYKLKETFITHCRS
ncbi:MAG: TnsA endonuclease N-terminal domain-containing protein [Bacteroidota bacterium]